MKKIEINPVSRIEGHAKVMIFADEQGKIERAFFQTTELRGYEKLVTGLPAEEVPRIVSTICGICRAVHFTASIKAMDEIFGTTPTEVAESIRKIVLYANIIEDHAASLLLLALPDLVGERDVFASFNRVGVDVVKNLMKKRGNAVKIIEMLAGRFLHPVAAVPGGWAKKPDSKEVEMIEKFSRELIQMGIEVFDLIHSLMPEDETFSAENIAYLTTKRDGAEFYDGNLTVLSGKGEDMLSFSPRNYESYVMEVTQQHSYAKLAMIHMNGENTAAITGVPARFYAGLEKYEVSRELYREISKEMDPSFLNPMKSYLLRALEIVHCAEAMNDTVRNTDFTGSIVNPDYRITQEGIGVVEAPRGTLIHHYRTDSSGNITFARIITPTQFNISVINRLLNDGLSGEELNDHALNHAEKIIRTFDPCMACSTHAIDGKTTVKFEIVRR
ncbi:Ni/Fe hydrogenase subunit alpha [Geoglobus sp.]